MFRINMLAKIFILFGGLSLITSPVLAQEDFNFFDESDSEIIASDTKEQALPEPIPSPVYLDEEPTNIISEPASAGEVVAVDAEENTDTTENGENADVAEELDDPKNRETWLESLITQGANELFRSKDIKSEKEEKKRLEKVLQNRRSNAALFDISQVKLRMSPQEVEKTLKAQGYQRDSQEMRVPNFIKWRSEELCRMHGVIGFERLKACAREVAAENGFEYIATESYSRKITREKISVFYTSTFTNNLSYYIFYESDVPLSVSKASQYVYINNLKIYDFWRRIDLRYGQPDNTSEIKWGLGGKKPFLKASTGKLELSDPLLKELDSARMLNEDARLANVPYYNF